MTKTYNLVAKFMLGNGFHRELVKATRGPLKEVITYTDVIPVLNRFLAEIGDASNRVDIPSCIYGVCKEGEFALVMQDIRPLGYVNNDKHKGLNHNQMLIAVDRLAMLHAVSFSYNKRHDFKTKFPAFKYGIPRQMGIFITVFFDLCVKILKKMNYNDSLQEKMHRNRPILRHKIMSLLSAENNPIGCLCHVDYWNNNFMFKSETHDGITDPDSIMLLDWGSTAWHNPVLDILYLIYTSTTLDYRKKYREEILKRYHAEFTAITNRLGAPAPFWVFEAFMEDCQKARIYGAAMGMIVNLITLAKHSEKEQRYESRVSSSALSWRISCRLGKIMSPIFFSKVTEPLICASVKKWMGPLFDELGRGENEILNRRFFDILNEANEDGVFDA
ncbi:uncharacterized protein LOC134776333 [Penaeus indicus]|uniref:uncharacterized protein LOC134776333 n=1 Tax=Penaeus indicus TaxID=29960 RepID=UPI00300C6849